MTFCILTRLPVYSCTCLLCFYHVRRISWVIFQYETKLLQLKGSIDDCTCNVDTVDYFNNMRIYPRIQSLLVRDYFRFYKVNLKQDCPFWADDSKCAIRHCHVLPCQDVSISLRNAVSCCTSIIFVALLFSSILSRPTYRRTIFRKV